MAAPDLFDRRIRRLARDRVVSADNFLREAMATELLERLSSVKRDFARVLELGALDARLIGALGAATTTDAGFRVARRLGGVQCDEDRLPFADGSFDLILSAGGLDSVNDLPGALALIRRALAPDGLFLAAMIGAPSLAALKAATLAADLATGRPAAARVHPQIEVRAAGDLLARAGFALPVADSFAIAARYPALPALFADLRAMGATNFLGTRRLPLRRDWLAAAADAFAARAGSDGKIIERFEILVMTGWAPSAREPR